MSCLIAVIYLQPAGKLGYGASTDVSSNWQHKNPTELLLSVLLAVSPFDLQLMVQTT